MTFSLNTESHGHIDAGFYSVFVRFARLGDHCFPTEYFCSFVKKLAQNPEIKKCVFFVYPESKFWDKNAEYIDELVDKFLEKSSQSDGSDGWLPELENWKGEKKEIVDHDQGKVRLEDELDIENGLYKIHFEVSDDKKYVNFGEYKMTADEFAIFSFYIAEGGWFGWKVKPDYAEPTINAIKNSAHPLFSCFKKQA